MAVQVLMPALGAGQQTARLVRWLKREGELVAAGEPLLEVETDKTVVEVESPGSGVLSGVRVHEGEEVRVGTVMAYLLAPAARPPAWPAGEAAGGAAGPVTAGPAAPDPAGSPPATSHPVLLRDVDASQLIVARGRQPAHATQTDLLLRLVAVTLARHPQVNSGSDVVNLAVTVPVDAGQVAIILSGAERLDVAALASRRAELLARVRAGRLRSRDLAGATFTVSNLGPCGVDAFLPVVGEGQVAVLGLGRIGDRVVPVAGAPRVRPVLSLALAYDPRRVDAIRAGRFLADLAQAIEEPAPST
jgi:pyruvate/2-oxoglutarate dehydrogenase complex dihydrolipoamide acyltransferase (E2) component